MFRKFVSALIFIFFAGGQVATISAAERLPFGFAGINVGDPWLLVKERYEFRTIGSVTSNWDSSARDCGSISLIADVSEGTLMVTVYDFVVTAVSETKSIPAGSDLFQLRQDVIETYGPPNTEIFKDIFGAKTAASTNVNYIVLYYDVENPVRIDISGSALWQQQSRVQYKNQRLHANKNHRCVRQKLRDS